MCEGELHGFFNLLNLTIQSTNVCIALKGGLLNFHHVEEGVDVVLHDSNDWHASVIEENWTIGFKLVFIDKGHDRNVVLRAHGRGDNAVIFVNEFFKGAHVHGETS